MEINSKTEISQTQQKRIAADNFSVPNVAFSMGVASGMAALLGNPLEVVKVSSIRGCLSSSKVPSTQVINGISTTPTTAQGNPVSLAFSIAKKRGLKSLYKGSQIGGVCLLVKTGTTTYVYEKCKFIELTF